MPAAFQQQQQQRAIPARKLAYRDRLLSLMREYNKILLIGADNIGSSHFQRVRSSLRDEAVILMGKNTVVRKILQQYEREFPQHAQIIPKLYGNLGFVFTNGDVTSIRNRILENKVGAPARVGSIAPCDVNLPAGPTGLGPEHTSFLQALNIPTMIVRGQIDIKYPVELIKEGEKVSPSQAALLVKLNLNPFKYGLTVPYIYDNGAFFDAKVLDSVPNSLSNAHKTILNISVATSHPYNNATKNLIDLLNNPEALREAIAAARAAAVVEDVVVDDSGVLTGEECDCGDIFGGGLFMSDDEEGEVYPPCGEDDDDDDIFGGKPLFGSDDDEY
uniref:Large ribosomal subunit protein uL10-like insertion domain-containing protein n=1 Tax=Paramoeba aestuarina TaxID=180227 RepID=A0A7S4PLC0_9EUKA|mmetsp:Transcript_7633/g.11501  ORF Transcript_7633/g.11501 Transcript_7633/m.11501 type:complete len:331 (+) Transcript_7633:193-1185(+)|eukprot:CAMPEP_0201510340 /NCGR_PEP_ID=MMETSP0161_2-20130828/3071_1 /ASSEMBLY_ACC=CAM_ASM_000251 /TAXON_ID=180227 /ORGANISM="Neoparamoeba aestuarina, Strain SoJaBio B1-5/56/2" /LENGTH=330 /DNA_ID=CAMNT_0047905493 /DNA_START=226 /DNA_END=1218 /DNA_ORIENTATION=-